MEKAGYGFWGSYGKNLKIKLLNIPSSPAHFLHTPHTPPFLFLVQPRFIIYMFALVLDGPEVAFQVTGI